MLPYFSLKSGDIYLCQEEDLFVMAYGLPLSGDGKERCLPLLNAVEETICRQLRASKTSSSKRRVSEGNDGTGFLPSSNLNTIMCI